jgi:hypothetical protein
MLAVRCAGSLNNQDGFVNSSCCNAGEALGLVCKILIAKEAGGTQLRHGALAPDLSCGQVGRDGQFEAEYWYRMLQFQPLGKTEPNSVEAMPEIWYRGLIHID